MPDHVPRADSATRLQETKREQDDMVLVEEGVGGQYATNQGEAGAMTYPDGGVQAWLVVVGATAILMATYGLMAAGGLFITFWKDNQLADYRETEISWIIAMFVFLDSFVSGPGGFLFDRFGATRLLVPCGLVYGFAFVGLAFGTKYEHFMACFILAGVFGGVTSTVAFAVLGHWFNKRKGLVMGITTSMSSIGGIFFSVILKPLLRNLDWRYGMLVIAGIMFFFASVAILCMKSRVPPRPGKFFDFSYFHSFKFLLATLLCMGFELVLHAGWGAIPRYSKDTGLGDQFYLMMAFNVGSVFGRLIPGYAMDKVGTFNVAIAMAVYTLVVMLCLWIPAGTSSPTALYAVAVLFGFGTGGFVSTSVACVASLSQPGEAGKYLGSAWTVVSLAVLASNPASHAVMDTGPTHLVWLLSAVVALSLVAGLTVRWACLGYRWVWLAKV